MKTDFHMHTEFSSDGSTPMEDMIAASLRERLDIISITDHLDIGDPFESYKSFSEKDYIDHFKKIDMCIEKYKGIIEIRKGMEIGYVKGFENEDRGFVEKHDLDFVIGSIHTLGDIDYYVNENDPKDFNKIESLYLDKIITMIENVDYYSVLGHINYPCKFIGFRETLFTYDAFKDRIDNVFKLLIEKGKGMEVNTSCLQTKGAFKAFLPVLKRYKELGGEIITIGSDSHNIHNVAKSNFEAQSLLLEAGFNYICDFKKFEPIFIAID